MNDFECAHPIQVAIIGQEREPVLKTQCGDPDIVMKSFSCFFSCGERAAMKHLLAHRDIVGNCLRVRSDDAADFDQLIELTRSRGA